MNHTSINVSSGSCSWGTRLWILGVVSALALGCLMGLCRGGSCAEHGYTVELRSVGVFAGAKALSPDGALVLCYDDTAHGALIDIRTGTKILAVPPGVAAFDAREDTLYVYQKRNKRLLALALHESGATREVAVPGSLQVEHMFPSSAACGRVFFRGAGQRVYMCDVARGACELFLQPEREATIARRVRGSLPLVVMIDCFDGRYVLGRYQTVPFRVDTMTGEVRCVDNLQVLGSIPAQAIWLDNEATVHYYWAHFISIKASAFPRVNRTSYTVPQPNLAWPYVLSPGANRFVQVKGCTAESPSELDVYRWSDGQLLEENRQGSKGKVYTISVSADGNRWLLSDDFRDGYLWEWCAKEAERR